MSMWSSTSPLRKPCWRTSMPACARGKSDGRRHHRLVWRDGAGAQGRRAGGHGLCLRRELLLRREFVFPDCASGRSGAWRTDTAATSPRSITSTRKTRRQARQRAMQRVLEQAAGVRVDITSEREGEVTGTHTLELNSAGDRIVLTHEAKSRRTFAEGAVLAAEWIVGKTASTTSRISSRSCSSFTTEARGTEKASLLILLAAGRGMLIPPSSSPVRTARSPDTLKMKILCVSVSSVVKTNYPC